ncbi:tRNA uridine-5-carboxymethylaminomethyl(34) synthesis GTPase MnmE [Lewinellaceae bacterium SD302]|nr:tRNA uridine-5-carboxymethylaminomethyl(34) synthesis GTPase MnmE [Lewinellaceae bacterium SD302]
MTNFNNVIIAPATPPGVGALAVIRLSGTGCLELVNGLFPAKDLVKAPVRQAYFGGLYDEEKRLLDEVLLTTFRGPHSFTGEDTVEISAHGSPYIVSEIIQAMLRAGGRMAKPGEFSQRAFLNGKLDLAQAEAVADLIASQSAGAHRLALHQLKGGVSREITKLRQQLIDFASLIELELDFGEEDVEFADRDQLKKLVEGIRERIDELASSFSLGNAIKNGIPTVIAGEPNAGKSTLLNALLQEDRAIVSNIPGTTRDTIEETLNIEGVTFRLIDTAGIREAGDEIEAIGVERTLEKVRQSSVLLYLFDVIETSPATLLAKLDELYQENIRLIVIANKMDLNPYTKYEHYFGEGYRGKWPMSPEQFVPIVASEASNIGYLKERLLAAGMSEQVSTQDTILSNARHYEALLKADEDLERVLNGLDDGVPADFVAMDIRQSLFHLGEITGQITTEDLLTNIFSNFCIGK